MSPPGATALRVEAECPLCGAPLPVEYASNAVRCTHCGADLLVTGRRQVLSYALPPRVDGREALAKVRFRFAGDPRARRLGTPRLLWVPYYRMTAESLCWRAVQSSADRTARLAEVARQLRIDPERLLVHAAEPVDRERQVDAQSIERTLLAAERVPLPPSLGPRSQALVLRRFDASRTSEEDLVLAPALAPAEARRRLLEPTRPQDLLHRELLNERLALVYLAVWTVELRGTSEAAALDGLTGEPLPGTVATADLGSAAARRSASSLPARTLGLRPLTCPNCAWTLPLRPDDVVFRCTGCGRAWLAAAARLFEVTQSVVGAPSGAAAARHLPVWELADRSSRGVAYAPAFRCRRLRALTDLATRLAVRRPGFAAAAGEGMPDDLVGCALDRRDAIALARFAAVGVSEKGVRPIDLRRPVARLLWLPFTHDGYAYCEAHTGAPFPSRLLDLAA